MSRTLIYALSAVAFLGTAQPALCDVITDWTAKSVAFVQPRMPPPQGHRAMTMVNLAMFDAVNSIDRRYRPYLVQLDAPPSTSEDAAAASAAAAVLTALLPQVADDVNSALAADLDAIPPSSAKTRGIELGQAIAARILAARATDRADAPDLYRPRTAPGVYVPTAPTLAPMWPNVTPFAMTSADQFRPGPPPTLDSAQWIADYNEIKAFGSRISSRRSVKQAEDARFWLFTGPQAYFPIVIQLISAKPMSVVERARLAALASIAMSDAILAVFDAKYHYEFWRPITAIRNGDLIKSPATPRDAGWQPIDVTPPHPEYPCAHCIVAAALVAVAERTLGDEVPAISATSPTATGVTHRWTNLKALVDEVSEARIFAGFHYRTSTEVGRDMGDAIGRFVVRSVLQPVAPVTR